ncbi:MAG TPA: class I SAM-dependent methyltransferase [Aggregatilineaceae bacterium]|nr:class I SAM-dependent methyltransferase [Aggregatilineaceae bacterium]
MQTRLRNTVKAITPPIIVDLYRKLRMGRRHRQAVGGAWDEIGKLQFDFLVQQGLKPHHRLVDVGCGSLRRGVRFIRYLDDGHYYGIDREQWLLDAGRKVELPRAGLAGKTIHLLCRDDFDLTQFGMEFDYALAQSVFTHLPWNSILRCLVNVQKVMKPRGEFYATFFEDRDGTHRISPIRHEVGGRVTYPDQDPYHYEFRVFEELAQRVDLEVRYIGGWNHPRDQVMMVFIQPGG